MAKKAKAMVVIALAMVLSTGCSTTSAEMTVATTTTETTTATTTATTTTTETTAETTMVTTTTTVPEMTTSVKITTTTTTTVGEVEKCFIGTCRTADGRNTCDVFLTSDNRLEIVGISHTIYMEVPAEIMYFPANNGGIIVSERGMLHISHENEDGWLPGDIFWE